MKREPVYTDRDKMIMGEQNIMESKAHERYEYIDFLKGIAAIGIIGIHTAFWGGESYVAVWFKNMTLLLDVPFFFYLSGWGSSLHRSNIERTSKGLGTVWCKWLYFVSALALFCLVSRWLPYSFAGVTSVRDLVNNYMFNVSFAGFPVVSGSVWFMQHYCVVVFINTFIMCLIQDREDEKHIRIMYMVLLAVAFIWICYGKYALGIDWRYFLFYSFFWMMGRNQMGTVRIRKHFIFCWVLIIIGVFFASYLQELPVYDIQTAKFPPTVKYGLVSLLSILIVKHIEPYVVHMNRWIKHIGCNAIFYYFSQGIGSSLNYYVIPLVPTDNWLLKFLVTFLVNVIITTVIAEFMRITYSCIAAWLKKFFKSFYRTARSTI